MKLRKKDELAHAYLLEEGADAKAMHGEKEVALSRLKIAKRDGTGTKTRV